MSDPEPAERVGNTVVLWAPAWVRWWIPLCGIVIALVGGVLQVWQDRAPWQFFVMAAVLAPLLWNARVPLLAADASGVRVGRRRRVPWSEVAEIHRPPDDGWKHPFALVMNDGTSRPLLRDLDPEHVRRIENLLAASRGEGPPF